MVVTSKDEDNLHTQKNNNNNNSQVHIDLSHVPSHDSRLHKSNNGTPYGTPLMTPNTKQETKILYPSIPEYVEPTLSNLIVERFEGSMLDGKPHGLGAAEFFGGNKYKGNFHKGMMHGKGLFVWSDGVRYKGDFDHNKITGRGEFHWGQGDNNIYMGDVIKGNRHGNGTHTLNNTRYVGEWHNGVKNGKGVMYYEVSISEDDNEWTGEANNGEEWEKTWEKWRFPGNDFTPAEIPPLLPHQYKGKYEGDWTNGQKQGYGVMYYRSNGNYYKGEWKNNVKSGHGVMYWCQQKEKYVGQWVDNLPNGQGEYFWYSNTITPTEYESEKSDEDNQNIEESKIGITGLKKSDYEEEAKVKGMKGNYYKGNFLNGMRHGYGEFYFSDGSNYKGNWENNIKVGHGVFCYEDGSTYDGVWKDDKMVDFTRKSAVNIEFNTSLVSDLIDNYASVIQKKTTENIKNDLISNKIKEEISSTLLRNISDLKKIYSYYSRLGTDTLDQFRMGIEESNNIANSNRVYGLQTWQCLKFLKDLMIFSPNFTLSDATHVLASQFYRSSGVNHPVVINPHYPSHLLLFREFIEFIVRIAVVIPDQNFLQIPESGNVSENLSYFLKREIPSPSERLNNLFSKHITRHILRFSTERPSTQSSLLSSETNLPPVHHTLPDPTSLVMDRIMAQFQDVVLDLYFRKAKQRLSQNTLGVKIPKIEKDLVWTVRVLLMFLRAHNMITTNNTSSSSIFPLSSDSSVSNFGRPSYFYPDFNSKELLSVGHIISQYEDHEGSFCVDKELSFVDVLDNLSRAIAMKILCVSNDDNLDWSDVFGIWVGKICANIQQSLLL